MTAALLLAWAVPQDEAFARVLARVYERAAPVTVAITVERTADPEGRAAGPVPGYFERPPGPATGTIWSADGEIVTSAWNVSGTIRRIMVRLHDGRQFEARLLGADRRLDVALLKIEAEGLPVLLHADLSRLGQGSFVALLGRAPDVTQPTITVGILSARNRHGNSAVGHDALQNYGNVGGPLVTLEGRLVGVAGHTAPRHHWGQSSGVGFACKAHVIAAALPRLRRGENVERVSRAALPALLVETEEGLRVTDETDETDLEVGDLIVQVAGRPVRTLADLEGALRRARPGQPVRVRVRRDGQERDLTVPVHEEDVAPPDAPAGPAPAPQAPEEEEDPDLATVRRFEQSLRDLISRAAPAYVFFGGGSGVVISPDGWILSNHHVAGEQTDLTVWLPGGRRLTADVIGYDLNGDVALLKARGVTDLPFVPLAEADTLRIGDFVVAVGDPFMAGMPSKEPTVTFGMASALHRYFDWYSDAIQTDARINPGNSGGPLIDMRGRVVGINGRVQIRWQTDRVSTGMGFAIPAGQIRRFLPVMKMGGRAFHGYIHGVTLAMPDLPDFRYLGIPYGAGVLVVRVSGTAQTPAVRAGLEPGDLIVCMEGQPIPNSNRLHGILATYPHGSTVRVTVRRREREDQPWEQWPERELEVWLGDPDRPAAGPDQWRHVRWGFRLAHFDDGPGLRVHSSVHEALRPGDRILAADGRPIGEFIDFLTMLLDKSPRQTLSLRIRRDGDEIDVEIPLAASQRAEPPPEE